ncbi:zinc-binding alcohol dehydrogenase family protein [uncultured Imperialibacter sp.]|uniref:zinc-binding alcohol dehydrogenase family protein n=1 Tax=uncultured Imperialibacter sp. TaxID=1672639 RepID=UPI0030DDAAB8|tara:strand:- start:4642 stop:5652 length:1011 start_codon:yes stop_codon:yes gene_type:complete
MKSLICTTPGQFDYQDLPEPSFSKGNTILKIKRIGICGTDLHAYEGTQPYFNYPRILGHELAAEIAETDAPGFSKGEQVTFIPYFNCGTCIACTSGRPNCCETLKVSGVHIDGGMAEYLSVPSYFLVHGNDHTLEELALVEPLAIGAHAVRRAQIRKGEFALVIGAGPIGLGIMEFARIAGAKVIAMDINDQRLAFCKEKNIVALTVNPSEGNPAETIKDITGGSMPTVVFDATGSLFAINKAFSYMAHSARYILVGLQKGDITFSHPEFHKREGTLMSSRNATREDFEHVLACMKSKLIDPGTYITHRVAFDKVKKTFDSWLDPKTGVIKAMVEI